MSQVVAVPREEAGRVPWYGHRVLSTVSGQRRLRIDRLNGITPGGVLAPALAALLCLGAVPTTTIGFHVAADKPVTFAKDVAPIIFDHCGECHRPGGWAPFSLLTY